MLEICCSGGAHNCHTCRVCTGSFQGCKSCLKCIYCQICLSKKCKICINGSIRQQENKKKYKKIKESN